MPELPEVETVKRGLKGLIVGKKIADVSFDWPKSFPNAEHDVQQFVLSASITGIRRRGKALIIDLVSKYSLVIHLKMTGQLVYVQKSAPQKAKTLPTNDFLPTTTGEARFGAGHPSDSLIGKLPDKSTRVIFCLMSDRKDAALEPSARKQRRSQEAVLAQQRPSTRADDIAIGQEHWRHFEHASKTGQCDARLFFNDQRKFGWVRVMPTVEVQNLDFFKKLGPEPLSADFTKAQFKQRLMRRKRSNIKAVLLDQTIIAGVGNIYADESLWAAKIHPKTLVENLSAQKINLLFAELQKVLHLAIGKGGSSDRNYVNAEGKRGSYLSFANVFRREGKPCPRCATIIDKIRVAGRGTHLCPHCQKEVKK